LLIAYFALLAVFFRRKAVNYYICDLDENDFSANRAFRFTENRRAARIVAFSARLKRGRKFATDAREDSGSVEISGQNGGSDLRRRRLDR
jgi:hypothetical protein